MEERFFAGFIHCYFIAFGVVIGGAIIGSIGSFATGNPPISAIHRIAKSLRIWAIAAAIGGTFDAIATFERGIFEGSTFDIVKQALYIFSAMAGVKTAMIILSYFIQEDLS
ncbi:MAG TPA: YtrH family sporulation protein [Candidatus Avamphibacillus intestinigallinarum]|nr:YtrH family sporulation protein [Candidatus Avamphibacillus intestinigallinarum]